MVFAFLGSSFNLKINLNHEQITHIEQFFKKCNLCKFLCVVAFGRFFKRRKLNQMFSLDNFVHAGASLFLRDL